MPRPPLLRPRQKRKGRLRQQAYPRHRYKPGPAAAGQLANEQFGPPELARLLGLSERTLYRRLGELTGLTPAAWLRELRLNQARQLLEAGGFGSVSEVADAVGFASAKHFSNVYAERFGGRPSAYRAAPG